MHYPVTDNIAIERLPIKKAFDTEGFVQSLLLCTVHSEPTLQ